MQSYNKTQIFIFLLIPIIICPQSINIHKNDGTTQSFILSEIDSITFSSSQQFVCGTSAVPYEGKTYNTVLIGDQCWLKENLDVGIMIQGSQNQTNNGTIEKYCYNNNPSHCETYGGLYQWDEAMQYITTEGAQGICPPGWSIPTDADYEALRAYVNYEGNPLKAIGQGSGVGAGTNTTGFSALLGGEFYNSTFFGIYERVTNWSSSEYASSLAKCFGLYGFNNGVSTGQQYKTQGYSIRCLKN